MKKEYEKLDREIFEETVGITKIMSVKKGERKKADIRILSDRFIDSLSEEVQAKLLKRLMKNISQREQEACECSLSKSPNI